MHIRNSISRYLIPKPRVIPHNSGTSSRDKEGHLSRSHRLLTEAGFIQQETQGYFTFLPLGLRSLKKLESLVESHLSSVGCQQMRWPSLSPSNFWKTSGRKDEMGPELMSLKNRRGKEYILGPTYEESVASFFSSLHLSYKSLPLYVYQITNKYRDELNPKFGLLRGNEFLMKDLYTFDVDSSSADLTYERITLAYNSFFKDLDIPYVRVIGCGSSMGSSDSHEYHYFLDNVGQDRLGKCISCDALFNMDVITQNQSCPQCSAHNVEPYPEKAIEIAHTFQLGTKYSSIFKADFKEQNGKMKNSTMCCFGIGLSRLLAATVESLSTDSFLRWPKVISPFKVALITPKKGSKEFIEASSKAIHMIDDVLNFMQSDVLIDDTENKTIGAKLRHAKQIGVPLIIVFGKDSIRDHNPVVEIHTYDDEVLELSESSIKDFVIKYYSLA